MEDNSLQEVVLKKELKEGYYMFGNKGACWNKAPHIAQTGYNVTLCGTPMLSSNWARIWEFQYSGCKECVEIYKERMKNERPISKR